MKLYEVIVLDDGTKEWWFNGKPHREDGPAFELGSGTKQWWLNGKPHREDGPAVEGWDGTKEWWLNGKLHREEGPAIEWSSGDKWWYLSGKKLSEQEHRLATTKDRTEELEAAIAKALSYLNSSLFTNAEHKQAKRVLSEVLKSDKGVT